MAPATTDRSNMPNSVTVVITYDDEIKNPGELADIVATCESQMESVIRVTAICGDQVVTRESVPA